MKTEEDGASGKFDLEDKFGNSLLSWPDVIVCSTRLGNRILCVLGEFRPRRMESRSQTLGFVTFVPWRLIEVYIVAWGRLYSYTGHVSCVFLFWRQAQMILP